MNTLEQFAAAQFLFEAHRHAEAAAALTNVLSAKPDFASAHALLALCQSALKQDLLAKHHAEKAIELEPTNGENRFILSRILVRLFDWELVAIHALRGHRIIAKAVASPASITALREIQEAIRLSPNCIECYAHYACLKLLFGKWGEALAIAEEGLAKDPKHIGCLHYRACAWFEMEELQKAEEATKCLLELDPNSAQGHAGLGDLSRYRRQTKEAEQHYLEALRLNPLLSWAERGLNAVREMETDRALIREYYTNPDPAFRDPYAVVRWTQVVGKVIIGTFITLVILQMITAMLWPKNSILEIVVRFLARL